MQATAKEFIIALDEGTTNAKAVVLDSRGKVIVKFSQPLAIQTPRDGWVEQSGEALVTASLAVIASAVAHVGAENVAALAISNQRETAIGWYRDSGEPINAAITWQCTRSAAFCDTLRHDRQEQRIKQATGLPIAPLFSASKMRWLLDATADGRLRAERGDDRQSRLTLDEQKTLLALWCMGRSPLMVGGDLPTSNSDAIALLQNPALREVLAGSTNNRETVRERIFGKWWDESTYRGEFIVWSADAADWADGTRSAHHGGHYAALFWTGSDTYEIGRNIQLQSIVGLDARNDDWTLADLYADAPGEPADVRLEGVGADRVITGTIPPHGVLWVVLDRR